VVRGLSYYTGVVFEAFDRKGELRAIAGGGRYDTLLETFGAPPGDALPAAGFGFGDAVIVELLKDRGLLPDFSAGGLSGAPSPDCVVYAFEESLRRNAVAVASELRAAGLVVDLVLELKKAKWVFKHADRLGAKFVVAVAPDEWAKGELVVKPMLSSSGQASVPRYQVVEFLKAESEAEDA
jgi:histidyl-tRNA synthetase